ncbi:hypothetical protein EBR96_03935, partial [bacterium]|nr:hypothetical protein [bacterium]
MSLYAPISALINFITSISLGTIFILKRSKFKNYAFHNFAIAFWSCFYFLWHISSNYDAVRLYTTWVMVGATLIPLFYVRSVYDLLPESMYLRVLNWVNIVCAAIFIPLLLATNLIVAKIEPALGFSWWPKGGPLFLGFLAYFFVNVVIAHIVLATAYFKTKDRTFFYLFLATLIGYGGGSTNYLLMLNIPVLPWGNIAVSIYVLIIAYAITKLDLLEISLVITRNVAWVITTILLSLAYFIVPVVLKLTLGIPFNPWVYWSSIVFLSVAIAVFPKMRLYIQTEAQKKFLKGHYDYKDLLTRFVTTAARCTSIAEVVTVLNEHLIHHIEIRSFDILVPERFEERKELDGAYVSVTRNSQVELNPDNPLITIVNERKVPIYRAKEQPLVQTILDQHDCKAVLPCFHNDQLMAVILLGEKMSQDTFTRDDRDLFPLLATQIGILLHRLKQTRVEAELGLAQRIQSDLLPANPTIPNIDLACFMQAATEMGGDYYDIFNTDSETWILLGDVTGHGVGSAMVMFMVQSIIATLIQSRQYTSPDALLYMANRIVCRNMERMADSRPLTILALRTIDGSRFELCGAHDPVLIYRADSHTVETIPADQFPMGIGFFEDIEPSEFQKIEFELRPGDLIYIGTDGVVEAAKGGKYGEGTFGDDGIKAFILENSTLPVNEFRNKL